MLGELRYAMEVFNGIANGIWDKTRSLEELTLARVFVSLASLYFRKPPNYDVIGAFRERWQHVRSSIALLYRAVVNVKSWRRGLNRLLHNA